MAIRVICICGRGFDLPDEFAGQRLRCPEYTAVLRLPTREEDQGLTRWFCVCGLRLKARVRSAGKKITCPRCGKQSVVPLERENTSFLDPEFLINSEEDTAPESAVMTMDAKPSTKSSGSEEPLELVLDPGEEPPVAVEEEPLELSPAPLEPAADSYKLAAAPAVSVPPPPKALKMQTPSKASYEPDEENDGEGIQAADLTRYFNAQTGGEAARAAVGQVLNGYWLFIPYALIGGCMTNAVSFITRHYEGEPAALVMGLVLPMVFTLFLWAGFVSCIKDGLFERAMGIERMLAGGLRHFLRFTGAVILAIPVWVGLGFVGVLGFGATWAVSPWSIKILLVIGALLGGVFSLAVLMIPPVVAVAENLAPWTALGRGLLFAIQHVWDIIVLTLFSLLFGGGVVAIAFFIYWMVILILAFALPHWLNITLHQFFVSLFAAAFMGQIVSSLMLLYLSQIDDEARLRSIQHRLRGVRARPWLLYLTIAASAAGLLALNYSLHSRESFTDAYVSPEDPAPDDIQPPPGWPEDAPKPDEFTVPAGPAQ